MRAEASPPSSRANSAQPRRKAPSAHLRSGRKRTCLSGRRRQPAVIARLRDADTLVLDDGTVVSLTGALPPHGSDAPGVAGGTWPIASQSKQDIASLVVGAQAEIIFKGRRDRYGRRRGHVLLRGSNGRQLWLQQELVTRGLARFDPDRLRSTCATALSKAEASARRSGKGVWSLPAYRIRRAKKTADLLKLQGTFQLVKGRVVSVKNVRGRYFLNFGKDWRRDFTAAISKRQMRYFRRAAIDPKQFEGRNVIVRGWVERYGGPYIEIRHTHQIELRDRTGSPPRRQQVDARAHEKNHPGRVRTTRVEWRL